MELLGRMTELMERMGRAPPERRDFVPPQYTGKGDVELFIRHFMDVAGHNDWSRQATLLHLRAALKEEATDCGRAEYIDGIVGALRARYGLTPREARARMVGLKRDARTTLHEHSTTVERLVEVAYPEVPADTRRTMAVDTFSTTIGNGYLQRHLLAVDTPTLEAAVRAGNEYLQIQPGHRTGERQRVTTFDDEREEQEEEVQRTEQVSAPVADPMAKMTEALNLLVEKIAQLKPTEPESPHGRHNDMAATLGCYYCGELDHYASECWEFPSPNPRPNYRGYSPNQRGYRPNTQRQAQYQATGPRESYRAPQQSRTDDRRPPAPRPWSRPPAVKQNPAQPAGNADRPRQ